MAGLLIMMIIGIGGLALLWAMAPQGVKGEDDNDDDFGCCA
jgi:hypothetical protein